MGYRSEYEPHMHSQPSEGVYFMNNFYIKFPVVTRLQDDETIIFHISDKLKIGQH